MQFGTTAVIHAVTGAFMLHCLLTVNANANTVKRQMMCQYYFTDSLKRSQEPPEICRPHFQNHWSTSLFQSSTKEEMEESSSYDQKKNHFSVAMLGNMKLPHYGYLFKLKQRHWNRSRTGLLRHLGLSTVNSSHLDSGSTVCTLLHLFSTPPPCTETKMSVHTTSPVEFEDLEFVV